jgi:hypothetical protein
MSWSVTGRGPKAAVLKSLQEQRELLPKLADESEETLKHQTIDLVIAGVEAQPDEVDVAASAYGSTSRVVDPANENKEFLIQTAHLEFSGLRKSIVVAPVEPVEIDTALAVPEKADEQKAQ